MAIEWDDIRVFQTAVRAGDYSTAARKLGMDRTTVGRRFARLERATERSLWEQTVSGYRPTEAGQAVLRAAAAMERAMTRLQGDLEGGGREAGSPLRLAGTAGIANLMLPYFGPFVAQRPEVAIEIVSAKDATAAVQQRHADIGITIARTKPADLAGARIADFDQARYVREDTDPARRVAWSHAMMLANPQAWARLNAPQDRTAGVEVGSMPAMMDAVRAGLGSAWIWHIVGDADERLKRLETKAPASAAAGLWVVHRGDLAVEPAVAAFRDAAADIVAQFIAGQE
jgi:DNA-binding transcriptional LysR family regulator|tara:strand:- start:229644 stop:230501 length:858 start_codon:yes stop_codon:yes gene_type:complete